MNIDHPFYCVWCGLIKGENQAQFDQHYEKCSNDVYEPDQDAVFDLINNENHY